MNVIERVMNNEKGYFACEKQYEDIWGIWFDMGWIIDEVVIGKKGMHRKYD